MRTAAVAVLVLAFASGVTADESPRPAAVFTRVVGTAEVREAGSAAWRSAAVGDAVPAGAMVRTGASSKAELSHEVGVIRMFQHTVLRLPAERAGDVRLLRRPELIVGQSLFDVVPSRIGAFVSRVSTAARSLFEVVTPHVVTGVKGTRFAVVELDGRSVVAVYEGRVEASDGRGSLRDTVLLTYGQLAEYREGRLVRVRTFDFQDDWSGWARPAVTRPSFIDRSVGNDAPTLLEKSSLDGGLIDGTTATLSGTVETLGSAVGGLTGRLTDTSESLVDTTTSLLETGGSLVDDATGALGDATTSTIGTAGSLLGN